MTLLYGLIAVSLTVDIARCNLRVIPQNTAVIADQMMSIECRTHSGSVVREWTLLRVGIGENHALQQHLNSEKIFINWNSETKPTHSSQFSVDVDQHGSGTLYSNSTRLEDAGLYACVIETGLELTRWSAHLIVFESTPFCETNLNISTVNLLMEGDRIWMRCSVRFRGYWTPSMEWRQYGKEDKDGRIVAADEEVENKNFNFTSTINVIFRSSTNNSFFSCKTYFSTKKHRLHASATNAPDFIHLWKSPEIIQTHTMYENNTMYPVSNPTPMTTTQLEKGYNSSPNLFLVSLTAVGILAASFCVVTTILCIRTKRTSSANLVAKAANEVHRPISSDQADVSSSSNNYENIDDETTITMQTVEDTDYVGVLHPGSRTSSTSDSVYLCPNQQIPATDKGYKNTSYGNQPFQAVLTLPIPDAEVPSPGGNCPHDLQDNSEREVVSYIKIVAQVREPTPYESLQPSSARDPSYQQTDMEA